MSTQAKDLIQALSELRHDNIDNEATKKEFKEFFRSGAIPEFYIATLRAYANIAEEAAEEMEEFHRKARRAGQKRSQLE